MPFSSKELYAIQAFAMDEMLRRNKAALLEMTRLTAEYGPPTPRPPTIEDKARALLGGVLPSDIAEIIQGLLDALDEERSYR